MLDDLAERMGDQKVGILLHSVARGNLKLMAPYKQVLPEEEAYSPTARYLQKEFGSEKLLLRMEDFQLTLEAMAVSLYTWVRAVFERGLFAPRACVLSLTSEGSTKAWRNYAAVGAAKAALEAVSRSMALEFAPYGLRSNVLQPGVTITPSFKMIKGNEQIEQQSILRNPYGRLTTPQDVANVVYLMSREEAAWINGAVIPVDGGESIA
ncbi:MAG: SDR family oxidoreductase [Owenweeksia sp.]|nr:SDR family oxidoreductase [Owenweeksia sp.]